MNGIADWDNGFIAPQACNAITVTVQFDQY
jgi:hypothetical protein